MTELEEIDELGEVDHAALSVRLGARLKEETLGFNEPEVLCSVILTLAMNIYVKKGVRFGAMLISFAQCLTGCSTTIVAGAKGDVIDASTGLPVQDARVTRPRVSGGYLIPEGGLAGTTVVSDRHGHFNLPPYRHTVFTLVSHLHPHGALDGSFKVAANGYETRVISGQATSQTSWRVEAGKVLIYWVQTE
jgi:hypothetical protein